MQVEPDGREPDGEVWLIERVVVFQVLRDDHEERWTRAELAEEASDCAPAVLDLALTYLERDGVLHREGEALWASRAARRLDELEVIGI